MELPNSEDQIYSVTKFDQISLRQNNAITLPNGVTIISGPAGAVTLSGADITANRFIGGSAFYPEKTLFVSPSFNNDVNAHTFSTISDALNSFNNGESATILVYEGIYNESITAKSKVSIVGVNNKKVIITSNAPKTVNVQNITDFELRNLTIINTNTGGNSYCLYVTGNTDTDLPNLDFIDLFIYKTSAVNKSANAVYCTQTSFFMQGCYLSINRAGLSDVSLINLAANSNPIFKNCRFKITNSDTGDSSIYTEDNESTDFTVGYCENFSGGVFININSASYPQYSGKSFFNISNVPDNNFNNRIDTPYNIIDPDFIIR